MSELLLIRQIRSDLANHMHYNVNGDNWTDNKYLVDVMQRIDNYLQERDKEYDEV